jgi:predicted metal-dependent phosphoesterase TrpH
VEYCIKNSIDCVAITDHNTIKGSIEAKEYSTKGNYPLEVIIGAEYGSDSGDIIGLFLTNEIHEFESLKIIDEIHRQGGIAILPHPYHGHKLFDQLIQKIDMIEVFNSRCSEDENKKALALAQKWNKAQIAGGDVHLSRDLHCCINTLSESNIKQALFENKSFVMNYSSKFSNLMSQYIKSFKKRRFKIFLLTTKSLISYYVVAPLKNRIRKLN